jgi:protein SCO1/2
MSTRPIKAWIVVIVAFALGLLLARTLLRVPEAPALERATLYPSARAIPALAWSTRTVVRSASSLRGHWTLVFFGFTQCPDVCPTTLATLARVRGSLADLPPAQLPRVLLISVDPERDTPQRLASYVHFFDPSFTAATGEPGAIDAVTKLFGVPYARVAAPGGGYTVDHGAAVFIVNPQATIVAHSSPPHAKALAGDYRRIVAYTDRPR